MLHDVHDHFLSFLRQSIGAPVEGTVAMVLRNIEKLAAELLEDVVAPEWDPGALRVYDLVGAAFSPPRWDFTKISGPHGISDLLHTIARLDASQERNEGSQVNQDDVQKWYRAALVFRYCLHIRKHGLTQDNFHLLAQAVCRMPTSATSKQRELMGRYLASGSRLARPSRAAQSRSRDPQLQESDLRSVVSEQALDLDVGGGSAELGRAQKRLVIEHEARRVLIDGRAQRIAPQPFKLLLMLAKSTLTGKGSVRNLDIEVETGRVPKELIHDLRRALKVGRGNAAEIHAWIAVHRSYGFELVLPPEQIELLS